MADKDLHDCEGSKIGSYDSYNGTIHSPSGDMYVDHDGSVHDNNGYVGHINSRGEFER